MNSVLVHVLDWTMPIVATGVWSVFKRAGKIIRSLDAVNARLDSFDNRIIHLETYKRAS